MFAGTTRVEKTAHGVETLIFIKKKKKKKKKKKFQVKENNYNKS